MRNTDTIAAIATPSGMGAIAVIRLTGYSAIDICDKIFVAKNGKKLADIKANSVVFGEITNSILQVTENVEENRNSSIVNHHLIDEVLVSVFRSPHSFTGEDIVEISCHGSVYIQKRILELLIENGATMAQAGEFTMRAFLNGKMDLPQAESIADLIESQSEITHRIALNQLRGGFSNELKLLHQQLLDFSSLLELELDFSEEDVVFADRSQLHELLNRMEVHLQSLTLSLKTGNALKQGIPVAIVGRPNVGKSTLLNALVQDERAIVSHISGTTRDTIEECFHIQGIAFRFIDTAGIRESEDEIEKIGIERSFQAIEKAEIVLLVIDASQNNMEEMKVEMELLRKRFDFSEKKLIIIANKIDLLENFQLPTSNFQLITISAKNKFNIQSVIDLLASHVKNGKLADSTLFTNVRHYGIMNQLLDTIAAVREGFAQTLPSDIIALEIRQALNCLGQLTGEITSDDILGNIFSKFCIGK